MATACTCTLIIKDDFNGEYEDDWQFRRDENKHVRGRLGSRRLTRAVVQLLNKWVATYPQCRRDELIVLGTALYEIAFGDAEPFTYVEPPTLQSAFESTLKLCKEVERPLRLRLVLESAATELGTYPWEFLYMNRTGNAGFFLAGEDTRLTLTRFVPNSDTWEHAPEDDEDGRVRILVVVSTPRIPGMTELEVGAFVDQLLLLDQTRFRVDSLASPTRAELSTRIEAMQPHVIHFIGHGRPGGLALRKDEETLEADREQYEDERERGMRPPPVSEAVWVDAYTACGLLRAGLQRRDAPQRLIFLHACEGATPELTRNVLVGFNDVARALVGGERITGVVAMQYTIGVDEAELFAKSFYNFISEGRPIDDAITAARKEFAETPLRGRQQAWNDRGFGTPVIYLRRADALVPPRSRHRPPPEERAPLSPAVKEPCPNANCNAYVLRSAQPPLCRVCQYEFMPCPRCPGLVVPKPGFQCPTCAYVYEAPTVAVLGDPGSGAQGAGTEPAVSRADTAGYRTAAEVSRAIERGSMGSGMTTRRRGWSGAVTEATADNVTDAPATGVGWDAPETRERDADGDGE